MPVYEYICDSCGNKFDMLRKIGQDGGVDCSRCKARARRLYSSVPMIFGGTRWVGERRQNKDNSPQEKPQKNKTETGKEP